MTDQKHLNNIVTKLNEWSNREFLKTMAGFSIQTKRALGIPVPKLRALAKQIGTDHKLALSLWKTGIHEARLLSTIIDDPREVTEQQMERWVNDFNSWDIVDMCCANLFDKTSFAFEKAMQWTKRKKEYVKRAGFAMMATLAVHDRKAPNRAFEQFFPLIEREAFDERNFVKKAVNWALRQIGKRNKTLNRKAIQVARRIRKQDTKSARWIASDAIRELTGLKIRKRFEK